MNLKIILIIFYFIIVKTVLSQTTELNIKATNKTMNFEDYSKFSIIVENVDLSNLYSLNYDNQLVKADSNGIFTMNYRFQKFYEKNNENFIYLGRSELQSCYPITMPSAKINNQTEGKIEKDMLLNSKITTDFYDFGTNLSFEVYEFNIIILRNKKMIYKNNIEGNIFPDEIKAILKSKLKSGDRIIFYDIETDYDEANTIELFIE